MYPEVHFDLPCNPTGTIFHGYQIVQFDPLNANKNVPQKMFGFGYAKMHGFHGNP